ncbi:hypothetical protein CTA1_2601, partial [Colletotrichum tanaceti]
SIVPWDKAQRRLSNLSGLLSAATPAPARTSIGYHGRHLEEGQDGLPGLRAYRDI